MLREEKREGWRLERGREGEREGVEKMNILHWFPTHSQ